VKPAVAGPKRPQDRIELGALKKKFAELLDVPAPDGYGKGAEHGKQVAVTMGTPRGPLDTQLHHGTIAIAAITSCTNTSNPSVMLAAGLLAKNAVERGMKTAPWVKTSLAPGSRVVTQYLDKTGLSPYLDQLGFQTVGYGCTTCIGNSGPLDLKLDETIMKDDVVVAAVLSGNRNFEARVHANVKANFLASPPLVVAFALAGRVDIDLSMEPLGKDQAGKDVFLRDLWPSMSDIDKVLAVAVDAEMYKKMYADLANTNKMWNEIKSPTGDVYTWDKSSTYIAKAPYFDRFTPSGGKAEEVKGARALAIFGDSITTDHISPAGSIKKTSPAGEYLQAHGVKPDEFNSYGARRGNHEVMVRGTFANVRIKNTMMGGKEGGNTLHQPGGEALSIYDAAVRYASEKVPLIVVAGQEYGTGSSRDWAAKGTLLLGVKAVIARSFERIHRSNLVGMGVLPCQFADGTSAETLKLDGTESFDLVGFASGLTPQQEVQLKVHRKGGTIDTVPLRLRIDTPIEIEYYLAGGILPYVLRQLSAK
jgi:aconitate hydratase